MHQPEYTARNTNNLSTKLQEITSTLKVELMTRLLEIEVFNLDNWPLGHDYGHPSHIW